MPACKNITAHTNQPRIGIRVHPLRKLRERVTLDTYTQAVTTEKRNAQEAVVALLCPQKMQ